MVFLEIFAGSGNLSKAARDVGYRILPVDSTTKRQTGVAMHVLDLTKEADACILLDLVCNANIASGHLAPPAGLHHDLARNLCLLSCESYQKFATSVRRTPAWLARSGKLGCNSCCGCKSIVCFDASCGLHSVHQRGFS